MPVGEKQVTVYYKQVIWIVKSVLINWEIKLYNFMNQAHWIINLTNIDNFYDVWSVICFKKLKILS